MPNALKLLKVARVGGWGFASNDGMFINGRRVLNPTGIPREWTMGKVCRRSASAAQRDRWTRVYFPITAQAALDLLSPLSRAIILPDNVPFVLPRDNQTTAHVLWRKANTYFELSALDDRTCLGLRLKEPRIYCHPPVGADVSKLLQLHADVLVIMSPKDIAALRDAYKVGVGCGEGWSSAGHYAPPHSHHPASCFLRRLTLGHATRSPSVQSRPASP